MLPCLNALSIRQVTEVGLPSPYPPCHLCAPLLPAPLQLTHAVKVARASRKRSADSLKSRV